MLSYALYPWPKMHAFLSMAIHVDPVDDDVDLWLFQSRDRQSLHDNDMDVAGTSRVVRQSRKYVRFWGENRYQNLTFK